MPREDAITFRDILGKLDMLRITCDKCGTQAGQEHERHVRGDQAGFAQGGLMDWTIRLDTSPRRAGSGDSSSRRR
jgi:hypothetical protein